MRRTSSRATASSTPVSSQPFARNNYGGTIGGPLIIPGLYDDTNRRTNFQLNYSGNHSTSLQDQYLTVPTIAMRNGDFSNSTIQLVNPATGQPFHEQPDSDETSIDPTALALLELHSGRRTFPARRHAEFPHRGDDAVDVATASACASTRI